MKQTFTKLGGALFFLLFLVTSSAKATTATWDFAGNEPLGIQSATNYGSGVEKYIDSTIDGVQLYVNTGVSGKFSMNGGTSYIQMTAGTIVRVPVVSTSDVVTISFAGNSGYCTLSSPHTATSAEVAQGYVEFGVSENSTYINSISVNLAYLPPIKPIIAWDWENDESVRTFDGIQKGTSKEEVNIIKTVNSESYTLTADCTEAGKFWPNGSTPQFTTGAKIRIPVSSTMDAITIKIYKGEGKKVIINGNDYAVATSTNAGIGTYTAQASDVTKGYVEIVSACDYLYSIKLEKNDYFTTATIGSTGWATFSNTSATNFTNLASVVNAYEVTGNTGSAITKKAVTTAAANTGLLLNAAAGTYAVPLATTGEDLSTSNKLVAGTGAAVNYYDGAGFNYVLAADGANAVFQHIVSGTNGSVVVPEGKAYLALNKDPGARTLSFDDETTAISEMKIMRNVDNETFYDMQGRRVAQPAKGLYIVNGRKVIVK